jgi:dTDP-glucose pyrophosphorylase
MNKNSLIFLYLIVNRLGYLSRIFYKKCCVVNGDGIFLHSEIDKILGAQGKESGRKIFL